MRTIWKYNLEMDNQQMIVSWRGLYEIMLPKAAYFLAIREQHGKPAIWFQVDTEQEKEVRKFIIVGTGKPIPEKFKIKHYLGMFFLNEGYFVGHVYEVT